MRKFKSYLNEKGITIVEVMVSAAMTAIVSLGIATMMQNSFKEQRRIVLLDTLKNQKMKLESMMRDQAIWNATMNSDTHNPGGMFAQMRSSSAVTEVSYTTPVEFKLVYTDNSLAYDLLGPGDSSGSFAGFTEKGQSCTGFNPADGSGTDSCPFSYRLMIAAECANPGASSCVNPQLKLVARLVYNPGTNTALDSYKNFISPVVTSGTTVMEAVQDSRYDAVVKRTATSVNRSFRLVSRFTPTAGSCATAGGGVCTNAFSVHPRTTTSGWAIEYDPHNLVSATTASRNFQFREQGYYGCIISAPGFATDSFTLGLVNSTADPTGANPISTAQVSAGRWSQGTAVIDAKFSVNTTSNAYSVWQSCGANLATISPADTTNCTLGVFTNYNVLTNVISVNCYKIDRAM